MITFFIVFAFVNPSAYDKLLRVSFMLCSRGHPFTSSIKGGKRRDTKLEKKEKKVIKKKKIDLIIEIYGGHSELGELWGKFLFSRSR